MKNPTPGTYEHYKGNTYNVIGTAKHTETGEELVIYRPIKNPDNEIWARPKKMFLEIVNTENGDKERFRKIN